MDDKNLMEGIDAKLGDHGFIDEAAGKGGLWSAFRNAMKGDPTLQRRLSDAALDAMVKVLKAEGAKYKGHLDGWRADVRLGLTKKANLDMFRAQARGMVEKSVLDVIRKML